MRIEPGQIWLDNKGIWTAGYEGEMVYVVCSCDKETDELWKCMCFQEWDYGAYKREFNENEINKMIYIGCLKDFRGFALTIKRLLSILESKNENTT